MQSQPMGSKGESISRNHLSTRLQTASQLFDAGKFKDAKLKYLEALKYMPRNIDLLQILGLIENELGNKQTAEFYFRRAIQTDPNKCSTYIHISQFYIDQNKPEDALTMLKEAIRFNNDHPELYCLIGDALKQLNLHEKAIGWYLKSIHRHPKFCLAYTKLGNCYKSLKKFNKAIQCYQKAININPDDAKALHNLGNVYRELDLLDDAIKYYEKALHKAPENAKLHDSLGIAFQRKRNFEAAHKWYQKALAISPNSYLINYHFGTNVKEQGKISESRQWFKKALELNPDFQQAKLHYLLSLPIIYSRQKDIDFYRSEYSQGLDTLLNDWKTIQSDNPELHFNGLKGWTNFNLPYQGKNDIYLQRKIGRYLHSVMKNTFPTKSARRSTISLKDRNKIRVGYVSDYMCSHTVGKLFVGWIEKSDPSAFDIYCYHMSTRTDQMTERYKAACSKFCQSIDGIESTADQIISDDIDILVYLDIGMNPRSQLLSALRLAPVQCVSWGHPVTTGSPSMDYFLSSDLMEPQNGREHYSETLIRLPNLSIFFNKPDLPQLTKKREYFSLCDEDFVYFSSQSLFKYLPEDDSIYAKIAQSVPSSKIVFLEHESKQVTNLFKQRLKLEFQNAGLDYNAYCIFQSRLSYPDFINLNMVSDVLLDPPAWSGGMTSLEGITCGLPIVTLPGDLMRSRHTYAILKCAGINETIAKDRKDYIHIASKLGTDSTFYKNCKKIIADHIYRIYEDDQSITGLERFYKSLVSVD